MQIIKSDGRSQKFLPNKVLKRLSDQSKGLNVDHIKIFQECVSGIVDGMSTKDIDNLLAITAAGHIIEDPDYSKLAGNIVITRQGKLIGVEPIDSDFLFDFVGITSFLYKYSLRDDEGNPIELPHMMYKRVAKHLFKNDKEALEEYNDLRWHNISVATPQLMNFGSGVRGSGISCNITTLIGDDSMDILQTLSDISMSSRDGAGIGLHIHNLRSKDSLVSSFKGFAGGVVRFADMVQSHMRFFKQGKRSGSAAMYLGLWHRDIEDFLELRLPTGDEKMRTRDLFTAACIPDLFYEKLTSGDDEWRVFCPHEVLKAGYSKGLHDVHGQEWKDLYQELSDKGLGKVLSVKALWNMLLKSLVESGLPYVFNWDNANKDHPQSNIGICRGYNLCVKGDTKLLTDKGNIEISSLVGSTPNVWNGEIFTPAPCFKTGEGKELLKVTLSDGSFLECTPEHRWFLKGAYHEKTAIETTTSKLKVGDKIFKYELPVLNGGEELKYAYTQGFYAGDGCNPDDDRDNSHLIVLYGDKKELLPHIEARNKIIPKSNGNIFSEDLAVKERPNGSIVVSLPLDLNVDKTFVPLENYSISSRLRFFEGLCDADGTICINGDNDSLQVGSINKDFLLKCKKMLHTLGIASKVTFNTEGGERKLPANDGSGDSKNFNCKDSYRLLVPSYELYKLVDEFGLKFNRLKVRGNVPNRSASRYITVDSIEAVDGLHETYCVSEPISTKATFNNILTGNCIEYAGVSDSNYTSQCNLGLIPLHNLKRNDFKEVERRVVQLTKSLNAAIEVTEWSTNAAAKAGEDQRTIGIGIAGLSDYLQQHGIPYDSDEAKEFNAKLMSTIQFAATSTSSELVSKYGTYPKWEGSVYEDRGLEVCNSLFVCLMPSASTSILLGVTESFEVPHSNIYNRKLDVGEFTLVNKYLVNDLKAIGLWNGDVRRAIISDRGSVQNIDVIPDNIKEVYRTIWEIKMKDYIELAAIRQESGIDQGQSMNLYFPEPTTGKIGSALVYGWKRGLPSGSYYVKSRSALRTPSRLALGSDLPQKPEDSQFDCFGCSS